MIPYLNMNCRIVIGELRFESCNKIVVEENLLEIGDTATITLPRNFQKLKDKSVLDYIGTGDKVYIEWGYNDNYTRQFEGYIREIEAEAPLVIHCDDNFYPLKQNNNVKSYKKATLKEVLKDLLPGYTIHCPDMELGVYQTQGSSFEELKRIQRDSGLYARMSGNTIDLQFAFQWQSSNRVIVYDMQKNVRKSDLKFRRKEDVNINVSVEYVDEHGKKHRVERKNTGKDNQVVKKEKVNVGVSKEGAEQLAEAKVNQYAYDGYTGSITGFGTPDTHAGDTLEIRNQLHPDMSGFYMIEKVTAEFAQSHISRQNTIGRKMTV